jgi:hypothetical protein
MADITIRERFTINGVLVDVTSMALSNAAGTIGVMRNDTGGVVVADGTPLVKTDTGIYEYVFTEPAPGLVYTLYLEYVYEGVTYRTSRIFDSGTILTPGRHLCTLADVKTRLGIEDKTDFDTIINSIIAGIDGMFDIEADWPLLMTDEDVTDCFSSEDCRSYLLLNRHPIISITSIKEASDYDFEAATALVLNTDYRPANAGLNGIIYRINDCWLAGEGVIEVKYRGGYCGAGEAAAQGEYALPVELREVAIEQAELLFKRKDDIGLSAISSQGGSISKFAEVELLPWIKKLLNSSKYKKPSL